MASSEMDFVGGDRQRRAYGGDSEMMTRIWLRLAQC